MPQSRQSILAALPPVDISLPEDYDQVFFTRQVLMKVLGGAGQALIVKWVIGPIFYVRMK